MIAALIIVWLSWGTVIGLEVYWRRPWVMWLIVPIILSGFLGIVSLFSSRLPVYIAIFIYLILLFTLIFVVGKDKKLNDWKRPKPKK